MTAGALITVPLSLETAVTEIDGETAVELIPVIRTVAKPGLEAMAIDTGAMGAMVGDGGVTAPTAAFSLSALACVLTATAVIAVVSGTNAASEAGRLLMSEMAAKTAEFSFALAV